MIMTYAIVQYRLMDIAVVANKGLAYGLMLVLIPIPMYLAIFFNQHITIYAVPLLLASFFVFVCGALVVSSNPAAVTNRTFGLLSLGACIWLVSMSMLYSSTGDDEATFWGKCIYVGIVYIPAVAYHFCVRLRRHTRDKLIIVNYLLGTVFLCISPHPTSSMGTIHIFGVSIPKPAFYTLLFLVYFFGVMAGALRQLYGSCESTGGIVPLKASRVDPLGLCRRL